MCSVVISEHLNLPSAEGKHLLQKVFNGGSIPQSHANNKFLLDLQSASIFCRWTAASVVPEALTQLVQCKDRPEVSILTYFWNVAEDVILDAWLEKLEELQSEHLSLHFDGIRVDSKLASPCPQDICDSCMRHIETKTKFKVTIRPKTHACFLTSLKTRDDKQVADSPDALRLPGNCIVVGLHHLGFSAQMTAMQSNRESEHEDFFRRRGLRSYRQVSEACDIPMKPCLEVGQPEPGACFLLHCLPRGRPHCVAVEVLSHEHVRITDDRLLGTYSCLCQVG